MALELKESDLSSQGTGALGGFNQRRDMVRFMFRKVTLSGEWLREARMQVGTVVYDVGWACDREGLGGGFQTQLEG